MSEGDESFLEVAASRGHAGAKAMLEQRGVALRRGAAAGEVGALEALGRAELEGDSLLGVEKDRRRAAETLHGMESRAGHVPILARNDGEISSHPKLSNK